MLFCLCITILVDITKLITLTGACTYIFLGTVNNCSLHRYVSTYGISTASSLRTGWLLSDVNQLHLFVFSPCCCSTFLYRRFHCVCTSSPTDDILLWFGSDLGSSVSHYSMHVWYSVWPLLSLACNELGFPSCFSPGEGEGEGEGGAMMSQNVCVTSLGISLYPPRSGLYAGA